VCVTPAQLVERDVFGRRPLEGAREPHSRLWLVGSPAVRLALDRVAGGVEAGSRQARERAT
jgi:hypothetical protein